MAENQQNVPPVPPPPYYMYSPRRTRWWIPVSIIGGILLIGIIFIVVIIGSIGSTLSFNKETFVMKPNSVLYLNLGKVVSEYPAKPAPSISFKAHPKPRSSILSKQLKGQKTITASKGFITKPPMHKSASQRLRNSRMHSQILKHRENLFMPLSRQAGRLIIT